MGTSYGRADRTPTPSMAQLLVVETWSGLLCGGGVERDTSVTQVSRRANVGRRCDLWARWLSDGKSRIAVHCWPRERRHSGGVMRVRGSAWPDPRGTAQVKGNRPLRSRWTSVTISQRTHLCATCTLPALPARCSPRSKVLAGRGGRGIENQSAAAARRLTRLPVREPCDLVIWRITVLTRAVVVYRLPVNPPGLTSPSARTQDRRVEAWP